MHCCYFHSTWLRTPYFWAAKRNSHVLSLTGPLLVLLLLLLEVSRSWTEQTEGTEKGYSRSATSSRCRPQTFLKFYHIWYKQKPINQFMGVSGTSYGWVTWLTSPRFHFVTMSVALDGELTSAVILGTDLHLHGKIRYYTGLYKGNITTMNLHENLGGSEFSHEVHLTGPKATDVSKVTNPRPKVPGRTQVFVFVLFRGLYLLSNTKASLGTAVLGRILERAQPVTCNQQILTARYSNAIKSYWKSWFFSNIALATQSSHHGSGSHLAVDIPSWGDLTAYAGVPVHAIITFYLNCTARLCTVGVFHCCCLSAKLQSCK